MSDREDGPQLVALLACDRIHIDPVGKSKSVLGLWVHRRMESYPATVPLCLYFAFSGCEAGRVAAHLRLSGPGDRGAVLLDQGGDVPRGGAPDVCELMIEAPGVTFPAQGAYSMEAYVAGELVARRVLVLHPGRFHSVSTG